MTTALDLALNVSLASYANLPPAQVEPVVVRQNLVKVERTKKGRTVKTQPVAASSQPAPQSQPKAAAPSPNGVVPTLKLPAPGTIGAKAFVMMMNRAKSREEVICAIAGYIGYTIGQDHGKQVFEANQRAKRELTPLKVTGPSREEIRSAQRSAQGYVAGMPDNQRKMVRDLLGREQLAVDTRESHIRDSKDEKLSETERQLATGLAQLEEERLIQIRADIAKLCG